MDLLKPDQTHVRASDSSVTEPRLLRVVEAARVLRVSRSKAYQLVSTGELPSIRIGSLRRVLIEDLDVFIAEARHRG